MLRAASLDMCSKHIHRKGISRYHQFSGVIAHLPSMPARTRIFKVNIEATVSLSSGTVSTDESMEIQAISTNHPNLGQAMVKFTIRINIAQPSSSGCTPNLLVKYNKLTSIDYHYLYHPLITNIRCIQRH